MPRDTRIAQFVLVHPIAGLCTNDPKTFKCRLFGGYKTLRSQWLRNYGWIGMTKSWQWRSRAGCRVVDLGQSLTLFAAVLLSPVTNITDTVDSGHQLIR